MLKKKSVNSRQISDVNSTISLSLSFWIIHNSDVLKGGGNTTVKTFLLQLILGNDMKLSVTYTIEFYDILYYYEFSAIISNKRPYRINTLPSFLTFLNNRDTKKTCLILFINF